MLGFCGFVLLPPWRAHRTPTFTLWAPTIRLSFCSALNDRPFSSNISELTVPNRPLMVNNGTRRPTFVFSVSTGFVGSETNQKSWNRSRKLRFHPNRLSETQEPRANTYWVAMRSCVLKNFWLFATYIDGIFVYGLMRV